MSGVGTGGRLDRMNSSDNDEFYVKLNPNDKLDDFQLAAKQRQEKPAKKLLNAVSAPEFHPKASTEPSKKQNPEKNQKQNPEKNSNQKQKQKQLPKKNQKKVVFTKTKTEPKPVPLKPIAAGAGITNIEEAPKIICPIEDPEKPFQNVEEVFRAILQANPEIKMAETTFKYVVESQPDVASQHKYYYRCEVCSCGNIGCHNPEHQQCQGTGRGRPEYMDYSQSPFNDVEGLFRHFKHGEKPKSVYAVRICAGCFKNRSGNGICGNPFCGEKVRDAKATYCPHHHKTNTAYSSSEHKALSIHCACSIPINNGEIACLDCLNYVQFLHMPCPGEGCSNRVVGHGMCHTCMLTKTKCNPLCLVCEGNKKEIPRLNGSTEEVKGPMCAVCQVLAKLITTRNCINYFRVFVTMLPIISKLVKDSGEKSTQISPEIVRTIESKRLYSLDFNSLPNYSDELQMLLTKNWFTHLCELMFNGDKNFHYVITEIPASDKRVIKVRNIRDKSFPVLKHQGEKVSQPKWALLERIAAENKLILPPKPPSFLELTSPLRQGNLPV